MDKLISTFGTSIDLTKTKVKNGPQKVTVFGGKTSNTGSAPSQRGIFLLSPGELVDCLVVPENFKNWNHFGIYNDLLSFEEDVCSLVDTVLIFLESAGSIAEFSAFIKHREIAPKLLIIFNGEEEEDSFIRLGLIRYLENRYPGTAPVITSRGPSLSRDESKFIIEEINRRRNLIPRLPIFNPTNTRHWLYLIIDFIDIMQVARISDIVGFLSSAGFTQKKKRVEQLLLALKNVGLINERAVLSERCFYLESSMNLIDYSFNSGSSSKRVTWKAKIFDETSQDRWRMYAHKQLKQNETEGVEIVA